jgi:outer membrane lipoprotein SlyB
LYARPEQKENRVLLTPQAQAGIIRGPEMGDFPGSPRSSIMKRYLVVALMLSSSVGCSGMNNTQTGAVEGGVVGGVLGTIVGAAFHNPLAGAAIGAGGGALLGAASGAQQDKRDDQVKQVVAAQQAQMMTLADIVSMTQQHVPDQQIINQIVSTYSNFALSANDIIFLRQQGVSDAVITVMQQQRAVPVGYVYPRRYYYSDPAPVGGVVIVGGGGYRRW